MLTHTFRPLHRWLDLDGIMSLNRPISVRDNNLIGTSYVIGMQLVGHVTVVVRERNDFVLNPGAVFGQLE